MTSRSILRQSIITKTSKVEVNIVELNRKAYDLTARLGSLYNARTDSFLGHFPMLHEPPLNPNIKAKRVCDKWWFKDFKDTENPLNKLNIQDELCLSLYLDICSTVIYGCANLVRYEKPIDQHTIFLLYSYRIHKQGLPENSSLLYDYFSAKTFDTLCEGATHIVHQIIWGFEVLFVIQVPGDIEEANNGDDIDQVISKICQIIQHPTSTKNKLTHNDLNLWTKLDVYLPTTSPFITFSQTKDITVIIKEIQHFETSWYGYQYPLEFILKPMEWFHSTKPDTHYTCFESSYANKSEKLQRELFLLNNEFNKLAASFQQLQETDKERKLSQQSTNIENKVRQVQKKRHELLQNLKNALLDVRRGKQQFGILSKIIQEPQYDLLRISQITLLLDECHQLCNKVHFIDQLISEHFHYQQIQDDDCSSTKERISKLFVTFTQPVYVLCSSDILIKQNENLWESYRQHLIKRRNEDASMCLVYADLSYCKHEDVKQTTIISFPPLPIDSISLSPIEQVTEKEDINVLLFGGSGVGKSTFINAFVNYLLFDSLEEALKGEPVVLIPVSFLVTITDKFDQFLVKFGDVDTNEDHDHPGQSATQHCKSYVLDISHKFRLRLIDTPGVGDTRGVEQDMINIDRILSYINNFSHISAICILLQPNTTRLNVFFRSCILQLFTYLTPAVRDNIIFCFTNARLTFFTPGNTAPLLKSFLKELPISDIPFSKKNSFCFDSESFRYLAAVKNNVLFNKHEQQNFHKSWTTSVTEAKRLLNFIHHLTPYIMSKLQSEKHAKLEINTIVRPFMEAFRKVLFTFIFQQNHQKLLCVELIPRPILVRGTICYRGQCKVTEEKSDILSITQYPIHSISEMNKSLSQQCVSCSCNLSDHTIIDYELNYKISQMPEPTTSIENIELNWWLNLCLEFACFISSTDPFIFYYDQFIREEQQFTSKPGNKRMHAELNKIRKYFREKAQAKSTDKKPDLAQIYQSISKSMSVPDIKSQIDAIKQSRSIMLKDQERYISKSFHSS